MDQFSPLFLAHRVISGISSRWCARATSQEESQSAYVISDFFVGPYTLSGVVPDVVRPEQPGM